MLASVENLSYTIGEKTFSNKSIYKKMYIETKKERMKKMAKIVIGGQIDKKEVAQLVEQHAGGRYEVEVKSDLDAAMTVKSGGADYYIGACNTGGGGALAMAIALVGRDKCATLSMPGKLMAEEEIRKQIQDGKVAFGFTAQHKEKIIPIIMDEILKLSE